MRKIVVLFLICCLISNQTSVSAITISKDNSSPTEFISSLQRLVSKYSPVSLTEEEENTSLNRLIVKTETNEPLPNYYGAIDYVEGYDGMHILQYESTTDMSIAYSSLCETDIEFIEEDYLLSLDNEVHSSGGVEKNSNFLSWSSTAVNVDKAFDYINSLGIFLEDITVAVFDTGVNADHPYFKTDEGGDSRIIDSKWIFEDDSGKYSSMVDGYPTAHGTQWLVLFLIIR